MSTRRAIGVGLCGLLTGLTQPPTPAAAQPRADRLMNTAETVAKSKLNAWTVGLAGGLLEGAPIRFATEIVRVVDEGDALHVLPVVTRGPAENIEALLFLLCQFGALDFLPVVKHPLGVREGACPDHAS